MPPAEGHTPIRAPAQGRVLPVPSEGDHFLLFRSRRTYYMPVQAMEGLLCAGAPVPEPLSQGSAPGHAWVPDPLNSVHLLPPWRPPSSLLQPLFLISNSLLLDPEIPSFASFKEPPLPRHQTPPSPQRLFWQNLIHSSTKQIPDAYSVLGTAQASGTQKTTSLSPRSFFSSVRTQTPNKQTHKGKAYPGPSCMGHC